MTNVKGKVPKNLRGFKSQRIIKDEDNLNKGNEIQCHECENFGYI